MTTFLFINLESCEEQKKIPIRIQIRFQTSKKQSGFDSEPQKTTRIRIYICILKDR